MLQAGEQKGSLHGGTDHDGCRVVRPTFGTDFDLSFELFLDSLHLFQLGDILKDEATAFLSMRVVRVTVIAVEIGHVNEPVVAQNLFKLCVQNLRGLFIQLLPILWPLPNFPVFVLIELFSFAYGVHACADFPKRGVIQSVSPASHVNTFHRI